MEKIKQVFSTAAIITIQLYQYLISPVLLPRCRFYPTCSNYAKQAIAEFGFFTGGYLAIRRLLRCHPFNAGGYDPLTCKENCQ